MKSRLLQEEDCATMKSKNSGSGSSALLNRGDRSSYRSGSNCNSLHCSNCSHDGHSASRCRGKDVNGRRSASSPDYNFRNHSNNSGDNTGQTRKTSDKTKGIIIEDSQNSNLNNNAIMIEPQFTCLMAKISNARYSAHFSSWIVDSGCTAHITYDCSLFCSYVPEASRTVEMGTKAQTRVAGKGDMIIDTL